MALASQAGQRAVSNMGSFFCVVATLLGAWSDAQGLPKVEDSVSAVTTAGATVLPYALIFGTLYFGGLQIW